MANRYDLAIVGGTVVTMDGDDTVIESGDVGVVRGRIMHVAESGSKLGANRVLDASGCIVVPGFLSTHQHTMDTLSRGKLSSGSGFWEWLFGDYYGRVLSYTPEDARRSAELAAADLLAAGITTVVDLWGVGDPGSERAVACFAATASAMATAGIRWLPAPMVADTIPASWDLSVRSIAASRGVDLGRLVASTVDCFRFLDSAQHEVDRAGIGPLWMAPELPEMASDELIAELGVRAGTRDGGFTTHLCASVASADGVGSERGAERLRRLGAFSGRSIGAHLSAASDSDLALLSALQVGAAHCPTSTMFGGGGPSVATRLRDAGLAVGLGLDNASLSTVSDMAEEMRRAIAFDRATGRPGRRLTCADVLKMATIEGACAIGMQNDLGSVEVGKAADLVVINATGSHWEPRCAVEDGLVLRQQPGDIEWVMVAGRVVVDAGNRPRKR